ncbi:MAG: zinc-ribbon domain-containing protein [Planctomycetota bacterium]|jgi:hypothetical protein
MAEKTCSECGADNPDQANFCRKCGRPLDPDLKAAVSKGVTLLPGTEPFLGEIVGLIRGNKSIESLKLIREKTGCSLREAKGFHDELRTKLLGRK